jgi:hypothetical protein
MFIAALGGTLKLVADFGDEQLKIASPGQDARVLGFATASRIADRYGLDPSAVQELLLDYEARGWSV